MDKPLLSLVAIVRDEEEALPRTLESVHGVVDHATILDTGSVDKTRDVARAFTPSTGVTKIHEEPFADFSTSRNHALDLEAERPDAATYALSLSADEVLIGGDKLRVFLQSYDGPETAFLVELRTESDVSLYPRVLKVGSPWRYEGKVHERPVNRVDAVDPSVVIPGVAVEHKATDPERRMKRLITFDLPALQSTISDASLDLPTRLRALLFVAQTYQAIGQSKNPNAPGGEWLHNMFLALSLFARRMEAGGDAVEVEHAKFHFLATMEILGLYRPQEMLDRLGDLENSRMPEVHFMIAANLAKIGADTTYERAVAAARLARDAIANPTTRPVSRAILWNAHLIAAHFARAAGKADLAAKHAAEGVANGGPREAFSEFNQGAKS